jgi:hypothetical protein
MKCKGKQKYVCKSPCKWVVGKGCTSPTLRQRSPIVGCTKYKKPDCRSPCKWVVGKGCRSPDQRRASPVQQRRASPVAPPPVAGGGGGGRGRGGGCTQYRKPECLPPCEWVVGKGCKTPVQRRASPVQRRRASPVARGGGGGCTQYRKAECTPPCEWIIGKGCKTPVQRRASPADCVTLSKKDCTPPCEWVFARGCQPPRIPVRVIADSPPESPLNLSDGYEDFKFVGEPEPARAVIDEKRRGKLKKEDHATLVKQLSKVQLRDMRNEFGSFRLISTLGKGSHGSAFVVSIPSLSPSGEGLCVMKVAKSAKDILEFQDEFASQEWFYMAKVGVPKPIVMLVSGIIIMALDEFAISFGMLSNYYSGPLLTESFLTQSIEAVFAVLRRMYSASLFHGDFHTSNIGLESTKNQSQTAVYQFPVYNLDETAIIEYVSPLLIDFGYSQRIVRPKAKAYLAMAELYQFIRTLSFSFERNKERRKNLKVNGPRIYRYIYTRIVDEKCLDDIGWGVPFFTLLKETNAPFPAEIEDEVLDVLDGRRFIHNLVHPDDLEWTASEVSIWEVLYGECRELVHHFNEQ